MEHARGDIVQRRAAASKTSADALDQLDPSGAQDWSQDARHLDAIGAHIKRLTLVEQRPNERKLHTLREQSARMGIPTRGSAHPPVDVTLAAPGKVYQQRVKCLLLSDRQRVQPAQKRRRQSAVFGEIKIDDAQRTRRS